MARQPLGYASSLLPTDRPRLNQVGWMVASALAVALVLALLLPSGSAVAARYGLSPGIREAAVAAALSVTASSTGTGGPALPRDASPTAQEAPVQRSLAHLTLWPARLSTRAPPLLGTEVRGRQWVPDGSGPAALPTRIASGHGSRWVVTVPAALTLFAAAAFLPRRRAALRLAPAGPYLSGLPGTSRVESTPPTVLRAQATPTTTEPPKARSTGASGGFGGFPGVNNLANVATMAAQEVSKAVSMRPIEAPDLTKTYLVLDETADRRGQVDEAGLPLVYDKQLIQQYWERQGGALQQRWNEFLACTVPFLTRLVALGLSGGSAAIQAQSASLARDARQNIERLGPTYIKMGQMLSVRPDVLPKEALDELAVLQDSVKPFPTEVAIQQIEQELRGPLGAFFAEISTEPVAAASLAQVYKATTLDGRVVAVKVQRPGVLELVSKDLYVLRRAAEVYQGLMGRFAPQQRTDYVALLNEWAVGFYTELDFFNEARNQVKLKRLLLANGVTDVYVPEVYEELCTRRLLVSEWVDGVKLSSCDPEEVRELVAIGQEAFLTQLLQIGFFHSDPHPGNLLRMTDRSKGRLALLDCGLMANIQQEDMDTFVSAIIHLSNKDYKSLVDDFIRLGILPPDCNRGIVEPLMDKALTPYIKGGGAKVYEAELRKMYGMDGTAGGTVGGFQAMTNDMLTVLNDIPFAIPPYMALLARAVVTLEGIALRGNPSYGIVTEAYPFVARKLLREDRPEVQRALVELLYGGQGGLQVARLAVVLNSAMGVVARNSGAFIDFDTLPDNSVSLQDALKYFLSPGAQSLRDLLKTEMVNAADLLLRQVVRRSFRRLENAVAPPAFLSFLPNPTEAPLPVLLPTARGPPAPAFLAPRAILEATAPPLARDEEVYALSLADLTKSLLGADVAAIVTGDVVDQPQALARVFLSVMASGRAPRQAEVQAAAAQAVGPTADQPLRELQEAVATLGSEERAALQALVTDVGQQLWARLVARAEALAPGAPLAAATR